MWAWLNEYQILSVHLSFEFHYFNYHFFFLSFLMSCYIFASCRRQMHGNVGTFLVGYVWGGGCGGIRKVLRFNAIPMAFLMSTPRCESHIHHLNRHSNRFNWHVLNVPPPREAHAPPPPRRARPRAAA